MTRNLVFIFVRVSEWLKTACLLWAEIQGTNYRATKEKRKRNRKHIFICCFFFFLFFEEPREETWMQGHSKGWSLGMWWFLSSFWALLTLSNIQLFLKCERVLTGDRTNTPPTTKTIGSTPAPYKTTKQIKRLMDFPFTFILMTQKIGIFQ